MQACVCGWSRVHAWRCAAIRSGVTRRALAGAPRTSPHQPTRARTHTHTVAPPQLKDLSLGELLETPPPGVVGLMYMLEGGTDASNTDPYATNPSGGGDWVKTGPHLMVVGAPSLNANYKGGARPDTALPYVMWEGTPYAHLMVPVG